jgi:hypothetical protein
MLGATAWAVSQDDFAAFVKKNSGVGTFVTTRKACVCHGGALDNFAGFAVLEFNAPGQPSYVECVVPQWGSDGQETIETGCIDKGGTVEVLAR